MITPQTVLLFLGGLLYGCAIGCFGYILMNTAAMKVIPANDREVRVMKRRIMARWWIRFTVDALGLFVLYKVTPMLLGAALGIVLLQKILIVKYTITNKKREVKK